jgi:hypothetical protein
MNSELMEKVADKALNENTWEEIEELFKPVTGAEFLLRLDFEGAREKLTDWVIDDSPSAMPFRFRPPYTRKIFRVIELEELYRTIKNKYQQQESLHGNVY